MSEIQKQGISNAVISLVGIGFGYVYTGIMAPFILTPDQIGLTSTLMAVALITAHVAKLGGPYMAIKFFPYFKESQETRQHLLNFLLLLTAIGCLLFISLYLAFQPLIIDTFRVNSALFADYNKLAIPFVVFMSFFEVLQAYSMGALRAVMPTAMRDVVWRLVGIVALLCYWQNLISFTTFIYIYSFGYAIPMLAMIIYLVAVGEMRFSTAIDLKGRRNEFFKYGQFVLIGSLATGTINEVDKVMISSLAGLKSTGIYQVAAFFSVVITVPSRSIMMIASPIVARFLSLNEMDKVERIYKKSAINQLIAGLFIFAGIYINLDNIFTLLPPVFAGGRYVIIFISISKLFDAATGINGEIILNSKYFRFDLYFNLALVAIVLTCDYLIIPTYGITGAAIASAATIFTYNATKSWFLWEVYNIQPFSKFTLLVAAMGVAIIAIACQIPRVPNVFADIFVRSSIMSLMYFAAIYFSGASEDINGLANKWLGKLRR